MQKKFIIAVMLITFIFTITPAPVASSPHAEIKPVQRSEPNWQTFEVTAYTLSPAECGKNPGHPDYGRTASGKMAECGITVAAGFNIPFGTQIFIPELISLNGTGIFTVWDRGGLIKENCIDIYFGDPVKDANVQQKARKFGRQFLKGVVIYD